MEEVLPSAEMVVGKVEASKMLVRAMPDSPASRRFQTSSMEWPIGVIQPIPVMTTLCIVTANRSLPRWEALSRAASHILYPFRRAIDGVERANTMSPPTIK